MSRHHPNKGFSSASAVASSEEAQPWLQGVRSKTPGHHTTEEESSGPSFPPTPPSPKLLPGSSDGDDGPYRGNRKKTGPNEGVDGSSRGGGPPGCWSIVVVAAVVAVVVAAMVFISFQTTFVPTR